MLRNVSLMRRSVPAVETPSAVSGGVCATASILLLAVPARHEHAQQDSDAKRDSDGLVRIRPDDAIRRFGALHRFIVELGQTRPRRGQTRSESCTRILCFFR